MLVSRLYILIISPVPRELCFIRTKLRAWPVAMKEILGDGPFYLISFSSLEAVEIGGVHVEVRALQPVVLLIMVDDVGNGGLLVETSLVDGILG